jgi:HEAT repeat protein
MRRILLLSTVLLFLLAACSVPVFAQESVEQYLLNLQNPKAEDYIKLLYEGSHENKLLAVVKLEELGAKDQDALDAFVFGLEQGTVFVTREGGRVVNDFWDVRAASARALGKTGDPSILPNLYVALRYDHDPLVRSAAAVAIGRIGRSESIGELARTIDVSSPSGGDDQLVKACVIALGDIGDKDGFVPLVEVIRGNFNRDIKITARESLKKIRW